MHKCTNCGNEFDGKFCPECGERADETVCPECGTKAEDGAKFCAECGHSFAATNPSDLDAERSQSVPPLAASASEESVATFVSVETASAADAVARPVESDGKKSGAPSVAAKLYTVLRYVPVAMSALFSVLLFLFYLAPIAEAPVAALFGGESESACNVYSMADGLVGISVTLIVCAALALLYAIGAAEFTFAADKRNKEVKLFGKFDMTLGEAVSAFSVAVYLIFVIVAGIAMGQVSGLNDDLLGVSGGMGLSVTLVECGAAPKLVMAFAVIFMVFAAAAVVARIFVGKKYPELWQKESAVRAERRAKRDAELAAESHAETQSEASGSVGDKALPTAKIERGVKPLLYYAYSNKKAQRATLSSVLCLTFTMLAVAIFMMISITGLYYLVSPHLIVLIGACCTVVSATLCFIIPVHNWSPESLCRKEQDETRRGKNSDKQKRDKGKMGLRKFVFLFILLFYITFISIAFGLTVAGGILRGYLIADIFGIASCAALIVAEHAISKRNSAMAEYLFGCQNPIAGAPPIVEYNEEIQRAAYLNYKTDVKEKRAKKDEPDVKKKTNKRRVKFAVSSLLIVAVSVGAIIASPILTDKFSASYVSGLKGKSVSDTGLGVQLGAPSVVRNVGEDSAVLEYYSDNYREVFEKILKLEKQAKKAETDGDFEKFMSVTAQIEDLKKEALTMTYQSLSVYIDKKLYFSGVSGDSDEDKIYNFVEGGSFGFYDAKIIGIVLDNNRCEASLDGRKNVKKVVCNGVKALWNCATVSDGLYSEVYYTDGSYKYMPLPHGALTGVDTSRLGSQRATVQDDWGEYTVSVNVVKSVSGITSMNGYKFSYNASVQNDGQSVRLAIADCKSDYGAEYTMEDAAWYSDVSCVTDLHFDGSINGYFIRNKFDLSKFTSLRNITVASDSEYLRAEDGVLYDKSSNSIIYAVAGAEPEPDPVVGNYAITP